MKDEKGEDVKEVACSTLLLKDVEGADVQKANGRLGLKAVVD